MKILHVIFSFNFGGTECLLVDILNEQAKEHDVELLIVNDFLDFDLVNSIDKSVTINRLNRIPGSYNPFKIIELNIRIYLINASVIHFHNHNAVKLLKFKTRAKKCLTIHTVNIPLENLHKYHTLFSISKTVFNDILSRGNYLSFLVYNGIVSSDVSRRKEDTFVEKFKIVQISRLDHGKKGQHILLYALKELIYNRGIKEIEIDFIGEGPSFSFLSELSKELKVNLNVNFLGLKNREFIYRNLKHYNLCVQPSLFEGFGLTVVEAMTANVSVLVSDIEGPMEIIDSGKYGFYFKAGCSEALADQIQYIISSYNSIKSNNLREEAYKRAIDCFDVKQTVTGYLANY